MAASTCQFSTAAGIRNRFEKAYHERVESLAKRPAAIKEPTDKKTYGKAYYADKLHSMRQGYQHPYHTSEAPIMLTGYDYMRTLFDAVGPEQVSPHYESLSKSRRGILFFFLYIASIRSLSMMGGWSNNEWLRGMIYHHEFIIAFYLSSMETRHFTYMVGPKFTTWYDVYTRYETQQLALQWSDKCEEAQMEHMQFTKEQMDYSRLQNEFDFVKKRAMTDFLVNQRVVLENHFTQRSNNLLKSVVNYEEKNLKKIINNISMEALEQVNKALADPSKAAAIQDAVFESALTGIREGSMRYANDPLLPMLEAEISKRVASYQSLSAEEESALLRLSDEQKRIIAASDRAQKEEFLTQQPKINNAGIKAHEKFSQYVNTLGGQH